MFLVVNSQFVFLVTALLKFLVSSASVLLSIFSFKTLGINPGIMSLSDKIEVVHVYGFPANFTE